MGVFYAYYGQSLRRTGGPCGRAQVFQTLPYLVTMHAKHMGIFSGRLKLGFSFSTFSTTTRIQKSAPALRAGLTASSETFGPLC